MSVGYGFPQWYSRRTVLHCYSVCYPCFSAVFFCVRHHMFRHLAIFTVRQSPSAAHTAATIKHSILASAAHVSEIFHHGCPTFCAPSIWNWFSGCSATWQRGLLDSTVGVHSDIYTCGSLQHKREGFVCLCVCLTVWKSKEKHFQHLKTPLLVRSMGLP